MNKQKNELMKLRLVPIQVFGEGEDWGYGLCDAVSPWSDCNRALGRIYRVDDDWMNREEGETIDIFIDPKDAGFFSMLFGEE